MTPAAGAGAIGVRYSRGEAFMASAGERAAVMLVPVRYNQGSGKTLFVIAGYNRSGAPINFRVPWLHVAIITGVAYGASALMTLIPARSASRVAVAEALRYE